ncbi:MAG: Chromate resistance protein ChrB [Syntrophomonadaceae bacterium]
MGESNQEWLLFLPQVPSSPSSLRVSVWRRMREVGAIGIQTGVWALPRSEKTEEYMRGVLDEISKHGGGGQILCAVPLALPDQEKTIEQFRSDRDEEYLQLIERCQSFVSEIDKTGAGNNYSFAELEKNEIELKKLIKWLEKIQSRDYFTGYKAEEARLFLIICDEVLHDFEKEVYARQGCVLDEDR